LGSLYKTTLTKEKQGEESVGYPEKLTTKNKDKLKKTKVYQGRWGLAVGKSHKKRGWDRQKH